MLTQAAWDVVIVGAGPAGSTSAALLAQRGHRVLLCDRTGFPRSKPCGESINPGAVRELAELGLLQQVLTKPHHRIHGWRILDQAGGSFTGRFRDGERGIGMNRTTFDSLLVDWAVECGATLRVPEKIVDVVREGRRVTGVLTASGEKVHAGLVIGADGLRSVLVRRLGLLGRRPKLRKLALTAHMTGVVGGELGELYITPWGCAGVASVDADTVNVVLVASSESQSGSERPLISGDADQAFDHLVSSVAALRGGTRTGRAMATGPFDFPTSNVVADGALLVGDAAGYFDPFTGQGIFRALRGARMAAETVDRCLSASDCSASALAPYAVAHQRAFRNPVVLQHGIEAVISRSRLFSSATRMLSTYPALANRLVAVAGDQLPVRRLVFPFS